MANSDTTVTCYWHTPTRILPHPYRNEAGRQPWSCLHDGRPRPLAATDFQNCATCPEWEPRTFAAAKRDLVFETWGVGIPIPEHRTFEEVRRGLVSEAWGV
jgi:hypothetical protein